MVKMELDLRGLRRDEALSLLEKQFDGALLAGLSSFAVIHGKGNGILQEAVQDYLKNCTLVESFAFSLQEAGGTGRTEVQLRVKS